MVGHVMLKFSKDVLVALQDYSIQKSLIYFLEDLNPKVSFPWSKF
jgi:hypothetical protein